VQVSECHSSSAKTWETYSHRRTDYQAIRLQR